ncbi:hypothetical protein V5799_033355 [Amblyomma americanum]|uniref:Uncharacterized protein n=1 Tax=Amblyomma americanum TaxID=6943 RepID=A0AAQ4DNJ7_AMBAM
MLFTEASFILVHNLHLSKVSNIGYADILFSSFSVCRHAAKLVSVCSTAHIEVERRTRKVPNLALIAFFLVINSCSRLAALVQPHHELRPCSAANRRYDVAQSGQPHVSHHAGRSEARLRKVRGRRRRLHTAASVHQGKPRIRLRPVLRQARLRGRHGFTGRLHPGRSGAARPNGALRQAFRPVPPVFVVTQRQIGPPVPFEVEEPQSPLTEPTAFIFEVSKTLPKPFQASSIKFPISKVKKPFQGS